MFAEVAVQTPMARRLQMEAEPPDAIESRASLGMTFHYAVPADLLATLRPGHLVWVPFGRQQLQGVVLDLVQELPQDIHGVRPLIDLVRPEPVCTPAQIELARWLSGHTLTPILDCILLMLPPGLAQKAEPVLWLTARALDALSQPVGSAVSDRQPDAVEQARQLAFTAEDFATTRQVEGPFFPQFPNLKPEQHALLDLLRRRVQLPVRVLERQYPELARRSVLDPLVDRGLVSRQRRIVEPPLRPKRGKQVALIANQEAIDRVLPTLGRSSRQADALAWLAANSDPLPALTTVCEAVGCSAAPLRSLARRGWVRINPERRWIDLLLTREQVEQALAEELSRAPAQAVALTALRDVAEAGPVDEEALRVEHNIAANTLAALARRGYVRRVSEDATVSLLLNRDQVPDRVIDLRGGEKYRRVLEVLAGEDGPVWVGWLYAEANTDLATLRELAAAGLISLTETEVWRDPLAGKVFVADQPPALTEDQARVWEEIRRRIRGTEETGLDGQGPGAEAGEMPHEPGTQRDASPFFLLHGVTGSGKTEIYLRAIQATLDLGRQAIVLVPEIALTPQTVRRFAARFSERITVFHSGLSAGERYDVWRRCLAGERGVDVVIGTRSALFLPMSRLGLIVLDEEHDPSYKESQRPPRYHARDAALHLAHLTGAVVILGSATPSLETYHAAQRGQLQLLEMPRRIMGHARAISEQQKRLHLRQTVYRPVDALHQEARYAELPPVEIVDLRQELRAGNRSMFSRALQKALSEVLASGQQAILFFNRRGSATFVICRDCGYVLTCQHCAVPMTYHEDRGQRSPQIVCHHCGQRALSPGRCPKCDSRRIRYLGAGTERIAEEVRARWPQARVVRWDRDVTSRKGSHDAILEQFINGQANVMVGTQMIAKGLDLPLVTLVGVISADVGLYLPDFRAAERSFQLLTQVAGRAGRSLLGGRVILQSYRPEHYAVQTARRHDYLDFYRQELSFRREHGYPPFRRLARLIYVHKDQERVQQEARALGQALDLAISQRELSDVDLIGPAPCFFSRERGKSRWHIIVRAVDPAAFLRTVPIPQGWRIDVDPISLL